MARSSQAAKVEAIERWAVPTTQSELRSFISVIGYYRRFVDGFARVAQPLTDLLREGQFEYPLPAAAQAAFRTLDRRIRHGDWGGRPSTRLAGQFASGSVLQPPPFAQRGEVLDIPARTSGHSGLPARVPVLLGGPPFRV